MMIRQIAAELYRCNEAINDAEALREASLAAAERVGAQVIGEARAEYSPHGLTLVAFLAESHILLTTYPEYRLLLLDALLCNERMSPEDVLDEMAKRFCPDGEVHSHSVVRAIGLQAGHA